MNGVNPLIQAPHVPKRAPVRWDQFIDGESSSTAPGKHQQHANKQHPPPSKAWAHQVRSSNPYQGPKSVQTGGQRGGPLTPGWVNTQQHNQQDTAADAQPLPQHQHQHQHQQQQQRQQQRTLGEGAHAPQLQHQHHAAPPAQHVPSQRQAAPAAGAAGAAGGGRWPVSSAQRQLGGGAAAALGRSSLDGGGLASQWPKAADTAHHSSQQQQQHWRDREHPQQQALQHSAQQRKQQQQFDQALSHRSCAGQPAAQPQHRAQAYPGRFPATNLTAAAAADDDDDADVQLPESWWGEAEELPANSNRRATTPPAAAAARAAAGPPLEMAAVSLSLPNSRNGQAAWCQLTPAGQPVQGQQQQQQWQQSQAMPQLQQFQANSRQQQPPAWQQQQQQQPYLQHQQQQQQQRHQHAGQQPVMPPPNTTHQQHMPGQLAGQHTQQQRQQQQSRGQQHQALQQQQQQPTEQPQKRTAASNLWGSGTVNLGNLSRVPTTATAARSVGRPPPAVAASPAPGAAAAAAAGADPPPPAGKGKKGSKASNKGGKAMKPSRSSATSSNGGVTVEFVPKAASDTTQQLKLHQTTLFDTLKRAQKNKQREQQQQQQQDEPGLFGLQNDLEQDDMIPAQQQQLVRKRKRSSVAAAAALGGGGTVTGTAAAAAAAASGGSGVSKGAAGGGSGAGRTRRKSSRAVAAAALEGAIEQLDTWHLSSSMPSPQMSDQILDVTLPGTAVWQQLQQELAAAEGVALGVLYSRTVLASTSATAAAPLAVQYFTSLQPPSKQQLQMLSKAAAAARKQHTANAEAAAEPGLAGQEGAAASADAAAGVQQVVGLAVMPVGGVAQNATDTTTAGAGDTAAACRMYFVRVQPPSSQQQAPALPAHVSMLLQAVLSDPDQRPCVCCSAKAVLCGLANIGLQLPAAGRVTVVDPELLGWLLDPQLIQDTKQDTCYSLDQQLQRLGQQVTSSSCSEDACGPLQRLQRQLKRALQLVRLLHERLSRPQGVAGQAIKLEMQVAAILAKMEVCGVACDPSVLSDHRATLAARLAAIKGRATQLVGRDFNLSSSSQLAKVLYEDLRLTPPAGGGGRGAAKTHLPTNEAALKQLAANHELPGLVLEHRCIVNVMSKWIDAQWVQQAAQQAGGRVHCTWQQTATATGRLSSCGPNLQAVTKYTITAEGAAGAAGPSSPSPLSINVRDAFVAPANKLLLSADYSQIELRLLAHISEDKLLRQILCQSRGDVFNMIAAALQQAAARRDPRVMMPATNVIGQQQVSPEERERAKRCVYGMIYGSTAYGLAQQLADQGVSTSGAQGLIDSFLASFPGVHAFMSRSISAAQATGAVSTLMGRRRPIQGLASADFQERSAAERKVVNSQIQGSAADLIKLAMCAWDEWIAQQQPPPQQQQSSAQPAQDGAQPALGTRQPAARLIAQIHDELLFEVDAADAVLGPDGDVQHPGQRFLQVAAAVKRTMEGAAAMTVPLRVKMAWGCSWGSLEDLEL